MPTYTYKIEGGMEHTWTVDNVIETANSKNELIFNEKHKRKQKCILEMMRLLMKEIKRHNIKIFAISGTLLGAKRNKGIIPYDDDGDFGFTMTEYDKLLELTKTFSHPKYDITEAFDTGFRMRNKGKYISHIDLFAMGVDSDPNIIVHISPIMDKKPLFYIQYFFPKDWMDTDCIESLEWCDFEDFQVPCPNNAEKQLAHIYSPTCLTTYVPDPRNVSGVDLHEFLHLVEPVGNKLMEITGRFNENIPSYLQPADRRGFFTCMLWRLAVSGFVSMDQSNEAKIKENLTIIGDYLKYKGVLL
jgi:hypothetical protein